MILPFSETAVLAKQGLYGLVPWHAIRDHHLNILIFLLNHRSEKSASFQTINLTLAAVKAVAKQAFLLKQINGDDLKLIEQVKNVPGFASPKSRVVSKQEIQALVAVCEQDSSPRGCRDAAIIGLLYTAGLSRHEISGLQIDNLIRDQRRITFDYQPLEKPPVFLKKKQSRECRPDPGTWQAIEHWLNHRGYHKGPLFYPINKAKKVIAGESISDQAVYNLVIRRVKEANLSKSDITKRLPPLVYP